jgi:hypothetical protein
MNIKCKNCNKNISPKHFNTKYCYACKILSAKCRFPNIPEDKKLMIYSFYDKGVNADKMSQYVGLSRATINRFLRKEGLKRKRKYHDVSKAVISFYEKNGIIKTLEKYPNIKVRSIIETARLYGYDYEPRQIRWQNDQIIEAAKMAGIISHDSQAKFFNRPNAFSGAIKSLWSKNFKCNQKYINGLSFNVAKNIIKLGTPIIRIRNKGQYIDKILWCDIYNNVNDDLPEWIKNIFKTLCDFQKWLHNSKEPNDKIINMIRERQKHE